MKTNVITLGLYSPTHNAKNVEAISGSYRADLETKQYATYSVENGLATITELKPFYGTRINLPMPYVLPVNDLGSGLLTSIDINADTLAAYPATCKTQAWVDFRANTPIRTIPQQLMADRAALL